MKSVKDDIKTKEFAPVYLLCGNEDYLKLFYRNKLRDAVLDGGDLMNYNYYRGSGINIKEVEEIADTMPFFSDRRVIVIENSGLFKGSGDLADYIKDIPETSVLIFVESEIDKRSRLFKAVKEHGIVEELCALPDDELKRWIASGLKKNGKRITEHSCETLIERVGSDMNMLSSEIEKLMGYTGDRDTVTDEDIFAICSEHVEGKIFNMMDQICMKDQKKALELYYDLLTLKEPPLAILALLMKQFNRLMQIKELTRLGSGSKSIAAAVGVPEFSLRKYNSQIRNYTFDELKGAIEYGTQLEEEVKTGRIEDRLAVELIIIKYSTKM